MISLPVIVSLALLPFVAAQDTALGIKAIEAHFTQSRIVPDFFPSFDPTALLTLNYAGVGDVTPGQRLTKEQVGPTPTVTITPANSSTTLNGTYTLAMVDADIVGADLSKGVTRHWLVNGVKVEGSTVTNSSAQAVTGYAGPWPASGSGPHRYIVALYSQPATFEAPDGFGGTLPVGVYDFLGYVKDSKLGALVAATYITVEEGTTTGSIAPTSAVVTSTLQPASTTKASGSGTGAAASATGVKASGAIKSRILSPLAAILTGLTIIVV